MADHKVHPMYPFHPTFSRSSSTTSSSTVAIQIPDQRMINREQEQSLILAGDDQAYKQKDFIYKTPTPLPPDHPSYTRARRRRRRRSPCCCCCAWVCSILAIIIILLGVAVLVLYLVLEPKTPQFSVTGATISTFNVTTQPILASNASPGASLYLNADVTFVVQAQNPNKKIGIFYDAVDVTLFYEGAEIGAGSIPAFYQGHQSTASLDLRMKGEDVALTPSIGLDLQTSLQSDGGSISLEARTIAQVRIKVGSWKSRDSKFEVDCDVQISNPSAAGNAHLLSKSCTFKVKSLML